MLSRFAVSNSPKAIKLPSPGSMKQNSSLSTSSSSSNGKQGSPIFSKSPNLNKNKKSTTSTTTTSSPHAIPNNPKTKTKTYHNQTLAKLPFNVRNFRDDDVPEEQFNTLSSFGDLELPTPPSPAIGGGNRLGGLGYVVSSRPSSPRKLKEERLRKKMSGTTTPQQVLIPSTTSRSIMSTLDTGITSTTTTTASVKKTLPSPEPTATTTDTTTHPAVPRLTKFGTPVKAGGFIGMMHWPNGRMEFVKEDDERVQVILAGEMAAAASTATTATAKVTPKKGRFIPAPPTPTRAPQKAKTTTPTSPASLARSRMHKEKEKSIITGSPRVVQKRSV